MPTPRFDAVLTALREPWFFTESRARATGAAQGDKYAKDLKKAFDMRGDKATIETGLNLGGYALHTQANKRKRLALRAVLLAEVLMMKKPATMMPNMRTQYGSLSFEALKRALVNKFPFGGSSQHHRPYWDPSFFTDPILLPDLRVQEDFRAKVIPRYMFLVHMSDDLSKPLWQDPVAELARYSGSSLTLMSNEKPYVYSNAGMVQGVIFRVPANNILLTYQTDLMTALHSSSIGDVNRVGHTLSEEILELAAASASDTGGLETPTALLRKTNVNSDTPTVGLSGGSRYNEVVVCGKAGVPLPWGVTGKLKLVGLFMLVTKEGKLLQPFDAPQRLKDCEEHAKRLKRPLLFLPNAP